MRTLVALVALAATQAGCDKLADKVLGRHQRPAPVAPSTFTEQYASPHKLVTAHYPPGFKPSVGGKNGIILARDNDDGSDEAISLLCIADPISQDSAGFAKVVLAASTSKLTGYKQLTSRTAVCNGVAGATEITGTWVDDKSNRTLFRRACAFTRHGHGYSYGYSIPERYAADHMPLFQAIVEATAFND